MNLARGIAIASVTVNDRSISLGSPKLKDSSQIHTDHHRLICDNKCRFEDRPLARFVPNGRAVAPRPPLTTSHYSPIATLWLRVVPSVSVSFTVAPASVSRSDPPSTHQLRISLTIEAVSTVTSVSLAEKSEPVPA